MPDLNEARRARLVELVIDALRSETLPAPETGESETRFTRRCLTPLLESTLEALQFPGLLALGTGSASMISCHLLGANFYPDLGIGFFGDAVFAAEVKFLRGAQRQNAIATAIGQALIYSQRFDYVAVVLIDGESKISPDESAAAAALLDDVPVALVLRGATRDGALSPHQVPLP